MKEIEGGASMTKRMHLRLDDAEEVLLEKFMKEKDLSYKSEACRLLIAMGNTSELEKEQIDTISLIVKEELDEALKVHNRRIRSILYKADLVNLLQIQLTY